MLRLCVVHLGFRIHRLVAIFARLCLHRAGPAAEWHVMSRIFLVDLGPLPGRIFDACEGFRPAGLTSLCLWLDLLGIFLTGT